ncbi:MAG: nitrilase-related carbon-nitrogen hydrolase [Desulfatiglandales bacterium]
MNSKMIDRYLAVGLQSAMWGITKKEDVGKNLDHIESLIEHIAMLFAGMEFPVKLVALPEQSIQGFPDSGGGGLYRHIDTARGIYNTTVPGPETERLGKKAKEHNIYIMACMRAVEPDFPDRYFNITFIVNPEGKLIYKHHKTQVFPLEPSCTPQDVYDEWVAIRGNTLDAFFPVADTQIGKIGAIMCQDGSFCETARGGAMNGAEILYRPTFVQPLVGMDWFEIQNRARAIDNSCYVISPNNGPYYLTPEATFATDIFGGESMIVDYRGTVVSRYRTAGIVSFVSALIDIKALREYRSKCLFPNFLKDLRTEQFRLIYEEPIHPKNLRVDPETQPMIKDDRYKILYENIERLQERGTFAPPDYEPPPEVPIEKPGIANMPKKKE